MSAYETYMETLDSVGEAILSWADPEDKFVGYTRVRDHLKLPLCRVGHGCDHGNHDGDSQPCDLYCPVKMTLCPRKSFVVHAILDLGEVVD